MIIPVNRPLITEADIEAVTSAMRDGWVSSDGPVVGEFERAFADYCGRQYAISVSNGSTALDLAISALDLKEGDEVIIPSFTIISCVSQVLRSGATPVFVDADPLTWCMDVESAASKITMRTKAVIAVHIYGLPVNLERLEKVCQDQGISLIEDAAEAHGLMLRNRRCGNFGAISTFSFYANKNVTSGEGGILVTDSAELAERVRSLRNLAFIPSRRFYHEELGWNYRLGSLQAALANSQLSRLSAVIQRRREIASYYREQLGGEELLRLAPSRVEYAQNDYWVFGLVVDGKLRGKRELIVRELADRGIATRPFFYPLHKQPIVLRYHQADELLPVAEDLGNNGFYLPNYLDITESELEYVSQSVLAIIKGID